ncbi:MAG: mycothiol synthase, partial [Mycobacteriales bacterium]
PLAEQSLLELGRPGAHLLADDGYARLDGTTAEVVVRPGRRRRGVGTALVDALRSRTGGPIEIWAHGDLPAAQAFSAAVGLRRSRVLRQLRRPTSAPLPPVAWPEGVSVRTFRPGRDEDAWLALNARAFAQHPEQGRWTRADLDEREAAPWFDPAGFFLAERGATVVGFHWTKVHSEERPPVGEVYVVGVDPDQAGGGLGRALTVRGLEHLRDAGLGEVLLYVDEDNPRALSMYEKLGFTSYAVDVTYVGS